MSEAAIVDPSGLLRKSKRFNQPIHHRIAVLIRQHGGHDLVSLAHEASLSLLQGCKMQLISSLECTSCQKTYRDDLL